MDFLAQLKVLIGADIEEFNQKMDQVSDKLSDAGSKLTAAGAALTAGITVPIVGLGAAVVKVAGDMEQNTIAFNTLLGSAEKAGAFLDQLKQFAASTPFEFPDLVTASKKLVAMGTEAGKVIPYMTAIGNAVAGIGGGKDVLDGVITAIGQMGAKGKVSAEEMNQLSERGIAAWQMLADNIGVSVPQAMKLAEKGAIDAATAIPAIIAGMNEKFGGMMENQSKTFLGQWSNFKDQITLTLMDIGKVLLPIAKQALDAMMPLIDVVKNLATWFGNLPQPVQKIAVAVAALAAAVGPVVLALGAFSSAIGAISAAIPVVTGALGVVAGAFSWPVVAIAAVTAALAALGVWIYSNWDAITAVVKQAWEGITEIWGAVWDKIVGWIGPLWESIRSVAEKVFGWYIGFYTALWNGVKSIFESVWNGIGGMLSSIWNGIKSVAESVWGAITSAFKSFIQWAEKIPGVNKLLNLDDAWNSAKKLGEETEKNTKALKDHSDTTKDAAKTGKEFQKVTFDIADTTKKSKKAHEDHVKPLKEMSTEMKILSEMVKIRVQRQNEAIRKIAEERIAQEDGTKAAFNYDKELEDLNRRLTESAQKHGNLAASIPPVIAQMMQVKVPIDKYYEALDKAGIKSTYTYNQIAADAKATYEAIANDPRATQWEKDNAMLRLLKAQADAAKASGVEITAAQQQTLDDLEAKVNGKKQALIDPWEDMNAEISRSITDLSTDMVKSLFEGDFSFADKGIKALKGLGEAVLTHFITPATKAISDFIANTITDLIGGKGLGGVMDGLKGIGKAMEGIFGSAPAAASTAGNAAGAGAGAAGAATSAVSSTLMATIGAIGSAVSAVTGVIGVFQSARQETTLNAIEWNTRKTSLHAEHMLTGPMNTYLPGIKDIHGYLWEVQANLLTQICDAVVWGIAPMTETIRNAIDGSYKLLSDWHSGFMELPNLLGDIRDYASTPHTINVTVNGGNSDPKAIANEVMAQITAQLNLQTAH